MPTAYELVANTQFIPRETKFLVDEEGARRINEYAGVESVRPGDILVYSESGQELGGGDPLYAFADGRGFVAVPHYIAAFEEHLGLPEWYDPAMWVDQG